MGAYNLLGEPLTSASLSQLVAVLHRIQHLVDQTGVMERSVATTSTTLSNDMGSYIDELKKIVKEITRVEPNVAREMGAETPALKIALAEAIAVINATSTTLFPRLERIERRLDLIDQRTRKLSEAMIPWWSKLSDRIRGF